MIKNFQIFFKYRGQEFDGQSMLLQSTEKELYCHLFRLIVSLVSRCKCTPWLPGRRASRFTLTLSFDISLIFPYGEKTLL